ncbi:tetratricopeptide repeat protein [Actinomadura vinacea]|uniref:Tetratricopeptide repeat protein n=1 Tax=Actinomadura vinacea TaxID=115336 RepID=A0ABN3JSZ5_9ACTN
MTRLVPVVLVRVLTGGLILAMVVGLTLAATIKPQGENAAPASSAVAVAVDQASASTLNASIDRLQRHLREQPRDGRGWAALGLAYVERGRLTADASYYPKADGAFQRSLQVTPEDNDTAYAGLAALAAARHDFTKALAHAARALGINAYGARALSSRIDALTELGRYGEAMAAAKKADSIAPGVPVFTRLAYAHELHGRTGEARRILKLAASTATDRGDIAYVRTRLGELAWSEGDHETAGREFAAALGADPSDLAAQAGRAKVLAARGDLPGAVRVQEAIVARAPLPGHITALGELYEARGQAAKARQQYAVAGTWATLAQANGVTPDLETAMYAADHGDKATALRAARAEWSRRRGVHVADALAWALHVNGKDEEALGYARLALRHGYRDATFRYHLGMIEKSLGRRADARRDLAAALRLNPGFSVHHAPRAREALAGLGGDGSGGGR